VKGYVAVGLMGDYSSRCPAPAKARSPRQ